MDSFLIFYTSFKGNYSLKRLVIPNSIASGLLLSSEAFYNCYSLKEIKLPNVDLLTTVGNGSFGYCYSLKKIIIPSNVTAIASRAFYYCRGIIEYDFSQCTSIPTLSSTDAFYEINPICKIKVPSALYETWITSVRWSTFADYIEAV